MFEKVYEIVSGLSTTWDKEEEDFKTKLNKVTGNYAGALLQKKELEIRSNHQDKREKLIRNARADVAEAYEEIKKKINKKFAYKTSRNDVPDINVLKSLQLTQQDVDVMVEQYKDNYLALRVIAQVCNEQKLSAIVPTVTAAYENLEKIKEFSEQAIHNVMAGDELGVYLTLKTLRDQTNTAEEALTKIVIGDVSSDIMKELNGRRGQ